MKTLKLLSLLLILSLAFSSCSDDPEPEPITKTQLLSKKWEIRPTIGDDEDHYLIDNYQSWIFNLSGSMYHSIFVYGSNEMEHLYGHWRFNEDETKIIMEVKANPYMTDEEVVWNIEELTESTLRVNFTMPNEEGGRVYVYNLIPYQQ